MVYTSSGTGGGQPGRDELRDSGIEEWEAGTTMQRIRGRKGGTTDPDGSNQKVSWPREKTRPRIINNRKKRGAHAGSGGLKRE